MQIGLKTMKIALSSVFLLTILTLMNPSVLAATENTTDTVDVYVHVNATAEIVVTPTNFTWTNLNPGNDGITRNFTVKNTGSYNVSKIYVSANTPTVESTNPLQTGNPLAYAASGFLFIQNSTTSTSFYHVGRLEWNLSSPLDNEVLDLDPGTVAFGHGWYRNRTETFLWKVENGTDQRCNTTGTSFVIKQDAENATTENRDLSSGTGNLASCSLYSAGPFWSTHNCSNGPLQNYCVAVYGDCTKIYIYKYDYSFNGTSCGSENYWRDNVLVSGLSTKGKVYASVPWGVPSGDTGDSVLTFTGRYTTS